MNIQLNLVSHSLPIFKENILPSLTSQQKKILAVVLAALTCLAACLYYYMRDSKIDKKIIPVDHKKKAVPDEAREAPVQPNEIESPKDGKKQEISLDKTLLLRATQPVKFSTYEYGGDDTNHPGITEHLMAENDEAREAPVQPNEIESLKDGKKQEISLDKTLLLRTTQPVKFSTYEYGGDDTNHPGISEQLMAENLEARMKIIDALGGKEACKKIPLVECPKLSAYLDCFGSDFQFPNGYAIVQGEDQAGRKFVLMRLENKTDKTIFIQRIFQRRRETCIAPHARSQDGCGWVMPSPRGHYTWGASEIAPIIEEIIKGTHPTYSIAPQI